MEVKISYLVRLENDKQAWLSVGKEVPEGATILEERPVLIPNKGKVLHKIGTEEYSSSTWLRDSTVAEWEEITQAEYEEIIKEKENGLL